MLNYSRPSHPVFCVNVPEVKEVSCKFIYNYYTEDESVNPNSGVSSYFLKKDPETVDTQIANFNLRIPRAVEIRWSPPEISKDQKESTDNYFSNIKIKNYLDKITSEDEITSSKFIGYTFSQLESVENAYKDIASSYKIGKSQSNVVDDFLSRMIKKNDILSDSSYLFNLKEEIKNTIETTQAIGNNPGSSLNLTFFDKSGNPLPDTSGFAQALSNNKLYLSTQINALVIPNVFSNKSLPVNIKNDLTNFYKAIASRGPDAINVNDVIVKPILIDQKDLIGEEASLARTTAKVIGYLINRYEITDEGFVKDKTYVVENAEINVFTDISVKYSSVYFYSVSTIAAIKTPGYDATSTKIRYITYLISSKAKTNYVRCLEDIPPPAPVDVNFVWDYKNSKLQVVWGMPVNSQRDIKQFQIFRRKSIYEPFELLKQHSFDYSLKKYLTGENIDGNSLTMNEEEKSFIDYQKNPSMHYVDHDFKVDIDLLSSSKYIYSICAIDTHGYSSPYSAQFEVTFDFFKNVIIKKLVSIAGAPKPYPNLRINIDLFKDVIKTSGQASKKMKVYFKPQCYKIRYNKNNLEQRIVMSKQDNSFYLMQFINLQNQKSDTLKIEINDPKAVTK